MLRAAPSHSRLVVSQHAFAEPASLDEVVSRLHPAEPAHVAGQIATLPSGSDVAAEVQRFLEAQLASMPTQSAQVRHLISFLLAADACGALSAERHQATFDTARPMVGLLSRANALRVVKSLVAGTSGARAAFVCAWCMDVLGSLQIVPSDKAVQIIAMLGVAESMGPEVRLSTFAAARPVAFDLPFEEVAKLLDAGLGQPHGSDAAAGVCWCIDVFAKMPGLATASRVNRVLDAVPAADHELLFRLMQPVVEAMNVGEARRVVTHVAGRIEQEHLPFDVEWCLQVAEQPNRREVCEDALPKLVQAIGQAGWRLKAWDAADAHLQGERKATKAFLKSLDETERALLVRMQALWPPRAQAGAAS